MDLKQLRQRKGITQRDLAMELGTTQQTIARWESGKTPITSNYLQRIAEVLGTGVDELLGRQVVKRNTRGEDFTTKEHEQPFGTLRIRLRSGVHVYPISTIQRNRLARNVPRLKNDWLDFTTLDNRSVLINPAYLRSLDLISDDVEAMPFYASPEAYKALTEADLGDAQTAIAAANGPLRNEIENLIGHLPGEEPAADELTQAGESKISIAMHYTRVCWSDGSVSRWPMLTPADASCLFVMENMPPDAFREISAAGTELRGYINTTEAAIIEAPLQRYLDLAEENSAESDDEFEDETDD